MSDTYGRHGSGSSGSRDLTLLLASRYQTGVRSCGSTMFELIWKARRTPSGFSIPAQRAWARPIDDSGFTSWPTTTSEDGESSARHGYMNKGNAGTTLLDAARMVTRKGTWSTTSSRDWKDTAGMATSGINPDGSHRPRVDQLARQVLLVDSGAMPSGSRAVTGSRGALNPAHSRWLMGFPPEWDDCVPTATRSSSRKRQLLLPLT